MDDEIKRWTAKRSEVGCAAGSISLAERAGDGHHPGQDNGC
nr:hypothetical protein [Hyphomonas sp.]